MDLGVRHSPLFISIIYLEFSWALRFDLFKVVNNIKPAKMYLNIMSDTFYVSCLIKYICFKCIEASGRACGVKDN